MRGPPPHRSSWDSRGRFRARSCASASASSAPAPAGAASASTASTCARRALHPNQHAHNTSAGLEGAECVEQWSRRASCVMLRGRLTPHSHLTVISHDRTCDSTPVRTNLNAVPRQQSTLSSAPGSHASNMSTCGRARPGQGSAAGVHQQGAAQDTLPCPALLPPPRAPWPGRCGRRPAARPICGAARTWPCGPGTPRCDRAATCAAPAPARAAPPRRRLTEPAAD